MAEELRIRRRPNPHAAALLMAKADQARTDDKPDTAFALTVIAHELVHPCGDGSTEHLFAWVEGYVQPTVHELAAGALLDPYLVLNDPPDGWHLIDNADADDVRHALEVAIERIRAVLRMIESLPAEDSGRWRLDADEVARSLRG